MTIRDVVTWWRFLAVVPALVVGCDAEPPPPSTAFAFAIDSVGETLRIDLLVPLNDPGLTLEATPLEADWVIGGTGSADSLVRFSRLADITPDGEGGLFAVDDRLREVLLIDSGGRLLDRFGREGDGPGEFRNPWAIERVDDRLLVWQGSSTATFQLFTLAGQGLASTPIPVPGDWVRPVNRHPHINAPGRQHSPEDVARRMVVLDSAHFAHLLETDESARLNSTDGGFVASEEPRFAYVIRYAMDSPSGPRIAVRDTLAVLPGTPVTAFDRIPGGPVLFEQPTFSARPVIAAGSDWYAIGHGDRRELNVFAADGSLRTVLRFAAVRPIVDDESKRDIARWILAMRMANSEVSREIFHSTSRGELVEWVEGTAFELTAFSERFPFVDRLLGAGDCLLLTTIEPRNTPDRGGWTFILIRIDGEGVFGPFRIMGGGDEPMYFDRSGGWVAAFDAQRVFVTQRDQWGEFSVGRYTLPGVRC